MAERLADDARFETLLSFAGRTASLQRPATPHRVGGFGGAAGLAAFLVRERFDALIDTTHPFAAQISTNAVLAARASKVPLLRLARPAWRAVAGDRWIEVASMEEAARALGDAPRRVFLTVGRLELAAFASAPQHSYLVRAIDAFAPPLASARVITARGPFDVASERALLERERIELLVSKNSGARETAAKLEAARMLGLPVVMVARPRVPDAEEAASLDAVLRWLDARHGVARSERGE